MSPDELFERRLSRTLRDVLDSEPLPHPQWAYAPAAERINGRNGGSRITPLRLLAIAALLMVGTGAAAGGVWLLRDNLSRPNPLPSLDARVGPTLQPSPEPTAQPSPERTAPPAALSDGWLAVSMYNGWTNDLYFIGPDGAPRQVVGSDGDTVWEDCPSFSPDGKQLLFRETVDDSSDTADGVLAVASIGSDGLPVLPPARIDLGEDVVCPVWSPDGTHAMAQATSGGLHLIDPVALTDFRVPGLDGPGLGVFEWRSDSQGLFYTSVPTFDDAGQFTAELWTVDLDGQENRRLLTFEPGTGIAELTSLTPTRLSITTQRIGPEDGGDTPLHFAVAEFDPTQAQGKLENVVAWDSDAGEFDQAPAFTHGGDVLAYIGHSNVHVATASDTRQLGLESLDRASYSACLIGWSAADDAVLVVVSDARFFDRGVQTAIVSVSTQGSAAPQIVVPWGSVGSYASCRASAQVVEGDWNFPDPVESPSLSPAPSQSLRPKPTPTAPPVAVPATSGQD